jgi:di/tricarboxylate transporter
MAFKENLASPEANAGKSGTPHQESPSRRIAYLFMAALGKKTLGLSYGLIARIWFSPLPSPSNTARAGGIVFPLVKASAKEMGKTHRDEWVMLGVFFFLLLLRNFGDQLAKIDSATTALVGVSVLVITGVLTWKDILLDTLVWFAALVMMASFLNELGLIPWFTKSAQGMVGMALWANAAARRRIPFAGGVLN